MVLKGTVQPLENLSSQTTLDAPLEASAKKEKKIKEVEDKASRNITMMVISIGFLFSIGNVPNSIGFCLLQVQTLKITVFFKIYAVLANITLFTTQSADIFIYYKFNKKYKTILKKLFGGK